MTDDIFKTRHLEVGNIRQHHFASIHKAVYEKDSTTFSQIARKLHGADLADFLEQISRAERLAIVKLWGQELRGDVLSELGEGVLTELLEEIAVDHLIAAVKGLQTDDIISLLEKIDEPKKNKILNSFLKSERDAIERTLKYSEDSAGKLMQLEVVNAPEHWNVGNTIDFLRANTRLPSNFYEIIVSSPKGHPIGVVPLGVLMSSPRETSLKKIMKIDFEVFDVNQSKEDVAYAFNQYHMVSAPVTDEDNRLVGVITIDDAMTVLEDETEEDLKRLAGLGNEELSDSVLGITAARFPWLFANLITAVLASTVIYQFTETLNAVIALAVLMPIVASMGGNAGTQTLTIAVRAIATRDLTRENLYRIIIRETLVGLMNGCVFAFVTGLVGIVWYHNYYLGIVIAIAMIVNMIVAGLAGILLPVGLSKLKVDPAVSSGVFVTTVTDIIGLFIFLFLASHLLL
ncbi:MAG: magnesium transporter [Pseudomonadota bacterium]|nr:magnesium transporter [Pseudomonadota bacterium]